MHQFSKPTCEQIRDFMVGQSSENYSYTAVGGTKAQAPQGFNIDRCRILLGTGEATYQQACLALRNWQMFPTGWTELHTAGSEQRPGVTVAMLARALGIWWLNACRIVYTFDDRQPTRRTGFAYGTLPGHVECGEERFMVEWDEADKVWYEIFSFSRPRYWLARLAYPISRRLQRKFVRQSMSQMKQTVDRHRIEPTQAASDKARYEVPAV